MTVMVVMITKMIIFARGIIISTVISKIIIMTVLIAIIIIAIKIIISGFHTY